MNLNFTGALSAEVKPQAQYSGTLWPMVALRFLVRRPSLFTIPKASSPGHATENAGAGDLHLTDSELARIDKAFPSGPDSRELPTL